MIINYNKKSYTLDLEEITTAEAVRIKQFNSAFTLQGLFVALAEGDPDALTALYWLMLKQNGEDHSIDKVGLSLKPLKFAAALTEAQADDVADETPKGE